MKKKFLLFFSLLFSVSLSFGQLQNGNFENGIPGGSAFAQGNVANWTRSHGTPTLMNSSTQFAWMWSYDIGANGSPNGEGILTNFNFAANQTYQITYRIRTRDFGNQAIRNNATVNILAANGVPSNNSSVIPNATNSQAIPNQANNAFNDYQDDTWTNVNLCFTPNQNYTQLWIYPSMTIGAQGGNQAEMSIDDITINPIVINPTTTADGEDISATLTATMECFSNCITINVNDPNLTNLVYNTSDPVLNNLQGLFCVSNGSILTSFTVNITGNDICGNPWTQNVTVNIEQDCCPDEPYIEPYWSHPNCPDVVCTADEWPINVLSSDGTPITSAGGVSITWTNTNTGDTFNQDWVYASPNETWEVTIVYPNGCEYTATYTEDCCDDDIHIEAIVCPEQEQLEQIEANMNDVKNSYSKEDFAEMKEVLEALKNPTRADGCDPCDEGWVIIHLVDAAGNDIDSGCSITWSDGGTGIYRLIPVDTSISVTVVKPMDGYECVYEDTFIYECREDCIVTAPTNLTINGFTLSWDPVPGAIGYQVSSPSFPEISCNCTNQVSMAPINTTNTWVVLPNGLRDRCFIWQVRARCADGSWSPISHQMCYTPRLDEPVEEEKEKMQETSVVPNPNNGDMSISVSTNYSTNVEIEVYDFYGRIIQTFKENVTTNHRKTINWNASSYLPKGIYFVKFKTTNQTINKRVIVE